MYKIATILNDYKVVINAGSESGVCAGQKYLVFCLSDDEILDPDTGKSLGYLEIVKGTGVITHVQEKMATLESATFHTKKRELTPATFRALNSVIKIAVTESPAKEIESEKQQLPFENPNIGDFVKQVN